MFITEGGAPWTIGGSNVITREWPGVDANTHQDWLIYRNTTRMRADIEGAGILLQAQYLFHSDPNYDSGLCAVFNPAITDQCSTTLRRNAYRNWKSIPSYS